MINIIIQILGWFGSLVWAILNNPIGDVVTAVGIVVLLYRFFHEQIDDALSQLRR